jgi:hypothetical protein
MSLPPEKRGPKIGDAASLWVLATRSGASCRPAAHRPPPHPTRTTARRPAARRWNFTPSPGWTKEELHILRLCLMRFGVGQWLQILNTGLLPGKLIQQLNGQTQRLLGQQSLAACSGLKVDIDRIRADNEQRADVLRKGGLIIYQGPTPSRETKQQWQREAKERWEAGGRLLPPACFPGPPPAAPPAPAAPRQPLEAEADPAPPPAPRPPPPQVRADGGAAARGGGATGGAAGRHSHPRGRGGRGHQGGAGAARQRHGCAARHPPLRCSQALQLPPAAPAAAARRHPPPATRHPPPATRHPPPATRPHPSTPRPLQAPTRARCSGT